VDALLRNPAGLEWLLDRDTLGGGDLLLGLRATLAVRKMIGRAGG
jgi:hypothetical protein